jgi:ABC-type nitrate/sulfonate/bicarbonate transport system permease component
MSGRVLRCLPFVLLIGLYAWVCITRHIANPYDKVYPTLKQICQAAMTVATQADRTGTIWLWTDLKATAERFGLGLAFCSIGVPIGLLMGLFPKVESLLLDFFTALDKVVALLLLPIVMVIFGIGIKFHVGLVVLAVLPSVILTAYGETKAYPEQLKTKARTLGASNMELAFRVVLPGIWPKVLDTGLRLNFHAIATMVFAAEMIVANEGIGYRIAAVRRFMSMDVVIVYVTVATILLYLLDVSVSRFIQWRYPYYNHD